MKFSLAVLCLIGAIDAKKENPVWSLRSTNDFRTDSGVQKAYLDHSTKQANARDPLSSALVQESDNDSSSDSDDEDLQLGDYAAG